MKTFRYFSVVIISFVLFGACHKCIEEGDSCPENINCTYQLVSVTVPFELSESDFQKISFSRTVIAETGEKIFERTYNTALDIAPYYAVILTDSQMNKIKRDGSKLRFELYNISGGQVYQAEFIIGHNCCHIEKIDGPDKIKI